MSCEVLCQEGRALREKRKDIDLERKNILLLSVTEDRPLTMEEVEKIFKLNKDHQITTVEIVDFVIRKCFHSRS